MRNPGTSHDTATLSRAARQSERVRVEIVGAECRKQARPLAEVGVFSLDIPFNRTADQPTAPFGIVIDLPPGMPLYASCVHDFKQQDQNTAK